MPVRLPWLRDSPQPGPVVGGKYRSANRVRVKYQSSRRRPGAKASLPSAAKPSSEAPRPIVRTGVVPSACRFNPVYHVCRGAGKLGSLLFLDSSSLLTPQGLLAGLLAGYAQFRIVPSLTRTSRATSSRFSPLSTLAFRMH